MAAGVAHSLAAATGSRRVSVSSVIEDDRDSGFVPAGSSSASAVSFSELQIAGTSDSGYAGLQPTVVQSLSRSRSQDKSSCSIKDGLVSYSSTIAVWKMCDLWTVCQSRIWRSLVWKAKSDP